MNPQLRWDAGTCGSALIRLQPDGDDHTVTITQPDGTPILGLIRRPDGTISIGTWPDGEHWHLLTAGRTASSDIVDAIHKLIEEFWDKEKADYHEQEEADRGYHPFDALQELKVWLNKPDVTPEAPTAQLHPAENESLLRLLTTTAELDAQLPEHDRTPYRDAVNSFSDPREIERLVEVARHAIANE